MIDTRRLDTHTETLARTKTHKQYNFVNQMKFFVRFVILRFNDEKKIREFDIHT